MKALFLHILIVLTAYNLWGQKASVQLIVESDEVSVNQPFTITVKSTVEGDIVENWPSNFTKGSSVQTMSRYVQDVSTGKLMQEHIVVFTGIFTKAGKSKLGPIYVKAGNKTYTSNTIKMNVLAAPKANGAEDFSRQQLRQMAFGAVEVSATKIYEGEPILISGRVYARERTYGRPILRKPFSVEGVSDVYPLQQNEMWENVVVKKRNYESFSFEKKVIFPVGTGILEITPFEIYLPFASQDFNVVSSVPTVEVLPLPTNAPAEFIGAVGEFSVEQTIKASKPKQGDIIQVQIVIAGEGNLHAIDTPKLPLPKGMSVYGDAEVKEDIVFNAKGATGKVVYTYFVQVANAGTQTINPVKIAYFNPKSEQYVSVSAEHASTIDVKENANYDVENAVDSTLMTDMNADMKSFDSGEVKSNLLGRFNLLILGLGGLVFIVSGFLFFLFRKRKTNENVAEQVVVKQPVNVVATKVFQSDINHAIADVEQKIHGGCSDTFYTAVDKTLGLILRHKLDISADEPVTRVDLLAALEEKKDTSLDTIKRHYAICDQARYGLGISEADQHVLIAELRQL